MFTKIKQFFLGKPAPEAQAPYKVEAEAPWTHAEVAPVTAPIVAEPAAAKKAAPKPKKPAAAKPAAKKPAAKKSV
jgi:hypothetical protein